MKMMPRVLLLLFTLSAMTMVFIAKCGLYIDSQVDPRDRSQQQTLKTRELFSAVIEENEKRHQAKVEELEARIQSLKASLVEERWQNQNLTKRVHILEGENETVRNISFSTANGTSFANFMKQNLQTAEILHGVEMKSEYEVFSFNRFTINRIFMVDPGLGKRVVEKPIGFKKKDLLEVISFGVSALNKEKSPTALRKYTASDFIEGVFRTEPTTGTHYELFYRNIDTSGSGQYSKVIVMRPFGPLIPVKSDSISTRQSWINMILPLKGRVDSFELFMRHFTETCIMKDEKVFLTIVYFGREGLEQVQKIVASTMAQFDFKNIKIVNLDEKFSRGRGLQIGALDWKGGDVVLFMCDVDIVFTVDFLERCRLNTERRKRVYYPIVFSLYNPHVVYSLHDQIIPPEKDQLMISKQTGFWRDFGYGMTCQFRSDFMKIKGFDEHITGWGGEDVALYKKYVRSEYIVVRATDPGIFHLWHEKVCDPNLSSDQYQGCIRSKALNEASHAQLGLLAFKDEVDIHRGYKRRMGERVSSYLSKQK
ncbi:chondroitin sulfate N-acetylgalactosaminyltransferase 1-like [Pecten maximus]|uniref:chondroitin sulfate N-acetylgalactosaminyltransferase 1-like n=1 Tax=Pecten maximus TaxID=6579 RepID=UPI001458C917|nr:chondroitin sulfate N-acetylgalactosaminyltransferase 1-like [Pecten maximus]XP_033744973.1 chondroitin sulfate N-acetylgalactosaminyltransferase 1-like [Pecten maximus]XP_033744980.1 chondroitin sulfate N-acetylgalactosaminyltransferase 1-like [Pecten maximus]XP_033744987.1 chondroitin sulfate N-acetylgalactosaminyltransferase 1-like [Pecten maximus]XP_033744995.1 chondroitin sulfate N-acetylgalactosaminyltransferase 1-like [Pecten maximus]XP_033745002.1 chondroitin sulfate N-acetylgalacto